jgi:hypothetical protein
VPSTVSVNKIPAIEDRLPKRGADGDAFARRGCDSASELDSEAMSFQCGDIVTVSEQVVHNAQRGSREYAKSIYGER